LARPRLAGFQVSTEGEQGLCNALDERLVVEKRIDPL
jgi:hypothetical protein